MNTLSLFNPTFTSDLFDVMNKTMIDFLPAFTDGNPPTAKLTPKIDVRETKDSYLMEMDLPGRTENDVEINLKDHVLSISSKIEEKKEEKKDGEWIIRERQSSSFMRRFTLPDDIDAEKVSASFKNGVLNISIPRKEIASARTIAISAEN